MHYFRWMMCIFSPCSASVGKLQDIIENQTNFPYNRFHFNEVYPGIYLGDAEGAKDVYSLETLGITHVLNAAFGDDALPNVDTGEKFYRERSFNCQFMGVPAIDIPFFNLSPYFHEAADFIETALKQNGKVYVHCMQGVSRSATLVIVYMMIKQNMSAKESVKLIRSRRAICPNDGFLEQICQLESTLRKNR